MTTVKAEKTEVSLYAPEILEGEALARNRVVVNLLLFGRQFELRQLIERRRFMEGSITATPAHGVIVDGVIAQVSPPRIAQPLSIEAVKNEEGSLRYHNAGAHNAWITTTPGSVYESLPSGHERAASEAAFRHWDEHPTTGAAAQDPLPDPGVPGSFDIAGIIGLGLIAELSLFVVSYLVSPLFGDHMELQELIVQVLAAALLFLTAASIYESRSYYQVGRQREEIQSKNRERQELISSWNENRDGIFREAFPSAVERAVFLDRLINVCEKMGLSNPKDFQVSRIDDDRLGAPCVIFQAQENHEGTSFLFNGSSIFRVTDSESTMPDSLQAI